MISVIQKSYSFLKTAVLLAHPAKKEYICNMVEIGIKGRQETTVTAANVATNVGSGKLIAGMKVEDAISRMEGITCGAKQTSCPDQMARALKLFLADKV